MRRALNLLRSSPHYRREAFDAGFEANGLVNVRALSNPRPGDVLLIWNRYGGFHETACSFEAAGATVLVAENCPLGNSWRPGVWYSLAAGNPAVVGGAYPVGGPGRWDLWRSALAPWRPDSAPGGETVVLGQRGIGYSLTASPPGWAERVALRLGARVRQHPGTRTDGVPLHQDLREAGSVVTWSSAAAIQAMHAGIPVWYENELFAGATAAQHIREYSARAVQPDRRQAFFRRLAWCMWELEEIASGDAMRLLLTTEPQPCVC